jgi:hypothetical protein
MFSASLLRGLHFFRARNLLNSSLQISLFHSYTGYEHNLYYATYTYTLCIDWSNANYHSGICRGRLTRRTQYRGFGPLLLSPRRKIMSRTSDCCSRGPKGITFLPRSRINTNWRCAKSDHGIFDLGEVRRAIWCRNAERVSLASMFTFSPSFHPASFAS